MHYSAIACRPSVRPSLMLVDQDHIPGGPIKTVPQFYFSDNFRKCTPILTIFSLLEQEIHAA